MDKFKKTKKKKIISVISQNDLDNSMEDFAEISGNNSSTSFFKKTFQPKLFLKKSPKKVNNTKNSKTDPELELAVALSASITTEPSEVPLLPGATTWKAPTGKRRKATALTRLQVRTPEERSRIISDRVTEVLCNVEAESSNVYLPLPDLKASKLSKHSDPNIELWKIISGSPLENDESYRLPGLISWTSKSPVKRTSEPPRMKRLSLAESYSALVNTEYGSDISIYVKDEIKINAHSLIIYARSPCILKDVIVQEDNEKLLFWSQTSESACLKFLKFIYAEELSVSDDPDTLLEVRKLGVAYNLRRLVDLIDRPIITGTQNLSALVDVLDSESEEGDKDATFLSESNNSHDNSRLKDSILQILNEDDDEKSILNKTPSKEDDLSDNSVSNVENSIHRVLDENDLENKQTKDDGFDFTLGNSILNELDRQEAVSPSPNKFNSVSPAKSSEDFVDLTQDSPDIFDDDEPLFKRSRLEEEDDDGTEEKNESQQIFPEKNFEESNSSKSPYKSEMAVDSSFTPVSNRHLSFDKFDFTGKNDSEDVNSPLSTAEDHFAIVDEENKSSLSDHCVSDKDKENSLNRIEESINEFKLKVRSGLSVEEIKVSLKELKVKHTSNPRLESFLNKVTAQLPGPAPCYESMLTPALRKELKRFGLKAVPRSKACRLLKFIHEETSSQISTVGSPIKECPEESIPQSQLESFKINEDESLVTKIKDFIRSDLELWSSVLQYEPIPLEDFIIKFKSWENGVKKVKLNDVMDALDSECITFRTKNDRRKKSPNKNKTQK